MIQSDTDFKECQACKRESKSLMWSTAMSGLKLFVCKTCWNIWESCLRRTTLDDIVTQSLKWPVDCDEAHYKNLRY